MMSRVLIIDDHQSNLDLLEYLLRALGHQPVCAHDGESGLELANTTAPELIICDITLPGMDGYAVAARLKAHPSLHLVPLMAVTGRSSEEERQRILAGGFDQCLVKPIDPTAFVQAVELLLRPRSATPAKPTLAAASVSAESWGPLELTSLPENLQKRAKLIRSMAASFASDVAQLSKVARCELDVGNASAFAGAIHKLLGCCVFFADPQLVEKLRHLERTARQADLSPCRALLEDVEPLLTSLTERTARFAAGEAGDSRTVA